MFKKNKIIIIIFVKIHIIQRLFKEAIIVVYFIKLNWQSHSKFQMIFQRSLEFNEFSGRFESFSDNILCMVQRLKVFRDTFSLFMFEYTIGNWQCQRYNRNPYVRASPESFVLPDCLNVIKSYLDKIICLEK